MSKRKKPQYLNPRFVKDENGKTIEVIMSLADYAVVQRRLKKWAAIKRQLKKRFKEAEQQA